MSPTIQATEITDELFRQTQHLLDAYGQDRDKNRMRFHSFLFTGDFTVKFVRDYLGEDKVSIWTEESYQKGESLITWDKSGKIIRCKPENERTVAKILGLVEDVVLRANPSMGTHYQL